MCAVRRGYGWAPGACVRWLSTHRTTGRRGDRRGLSRAREQAWWPRSRRQGDPPRVRSPGRLRHALSPDHPGDRQARQPSPHPAHVGQRRTGRLPLPHHPLRRRWHPQRLARPRRTHGPGGHRPVLSPALRSPRLRPQPRRGPWQRQAVQCLPLRRAARHARRLRPALGRRAYGRQPGRIRRRRARIHGAKSRMASFRPSATSTAPAR